jgi:hypothetical protein
MKTGKFSMDRKTRPPNEKLHSNFLRRIDEILSLCDFPCTLGVCGEDFRVPEVRVLIAT